MFFFIESSKSMYSGKEGEELIKTPVKAEGNS
jgi:hypothetical protein